MQSTYRKPLEGTLAQPTKPLGHGSIARQIEELLRKLAQPGFAVCESFELEGRREETREGLAHVTVWAPKSLERFEIAQIVFSCAIRGLRLMRREIDSGDLSLHFQETVSRQALTSSENFYFRCDCCGREGWQESGDAECDFCHRTMTLLETAEVAA